MCCRAEDIDIPDPDEDEDEEVIIEQRRLARKEFEQVNVQPFAMMIVLEFSCHNTFYLCYCHCLQEISIPCLLTFDALTLLVDYCV